MKGHDFILTGLQSWDIPIGSNAIDIAREIARDNRVLYVNSPLDHMTIYRNRKNTGADRRLAVLRGKAAPLRHVGENIWILDLPFSIWSVNQLPDGPLFDFFNKRNNQKIFRYVQRVAAGLGFHQAIHLIDNDIYRSFYAKEILDARLSVYYRRDNLHPFPYWKKHVGRLEPMLIDKSDIVICNSPQLAEYALAFNKNSHDVGQGVDLSAYDANAGLPEPEAFRSIQGPRIGYIGDINSLRLDADLIYLVAKTLPHHAFVMIGPQDATFQSHDLHKLDNVHFLGSIPKHLVPQYMAALDVCLNPQQLNEITIGNYPRKIDEYLAMGKPVVATRTKTMELFEEHTYLCSSPGEYRDAIITALREDDEDKIRSRQAFARTHTWENNVRKIYSHIHNSLNTQS